MLQREVEVHSEGTLGNPCGPCPDLRRQVAPDWSLGWVWPGGFRGEFLLGKLIPNLKGRDLGLLVLNKLFGGKRWYRKVG